MTLSQLCLAILIAAIGVQQRVGSAMPEEISYKLLDPHGVHYGDESHVSYSVSVDVFMDRPQIEHLICQVLRDQRPASYSRLSIKIYYKLDRWIPSSFLFEREEFEHGVAEYRWYVNLPDTRDRLVIWRDAQGKRIKLPEVFDFDHTKACK